MKIIVFFILEILFVYVFTSCNEKCNCKFDKSIISHNDSIIKSFDSSNFCAIFQIPKLFSFEYNSFRLFIYPSYHCEKRIYTLINDPHSPYLTINYFSIYNDKMLKDSLHHEEKYRLTTKQFQNFEEYLNENCFWTMKSDSELTVDGVGWFIEGYSSKKNSCSERNYHIVNRWVHDSIFFLFCDEILKLANTSLAEQEEINYNNWTRK